MRTSKRDAGTGVLVLLCLITIVGYADRQVIALLKPVLDREFGWTSSDYGLISSGFQAAVAAGFLVAGGIVDRFGPRWSLGLGLAGWSLAAVLHAAARTVGAFLGLRIWLGLFEAVGTPAGMAAVGAYFPGARRGRVIGLLNAVPNLAAMLTPLSVSLLYPLVGWRGTVVIIGASGFVCAGAWLLLPQRPAAGETTAAAIVADPAVVEHKPMLRRMVAAFALAKLITDPVWWFMLFWLPDLFHRRYGLDLAHLGLPLAAVYGCAAVGALLGGYLPHWLQRAGVAPETARRRVMGVAALLVLPLPLVLLTHGLAAGIALVGLALASHQAFASSLFGFVTERMPLARVGRTTGTGAFCGNLGGAIGLRLAGGLVGVPNGLLAVFTYSAVAYGVAWTLFMLLAPADRVARSPI